jgi:sulfate adenylyltransferase subunit 2
MQDDARLQPKANEEVVMRKIRFRTLGDYPLTAAVESDADTIEAVVAETVNAQTSEREGRLIDHDQVGAMEKKKQEGYF